MTLLHVHCGDEAAAVARRAPLPGDVLAWRDSSAVGPCGADPATHRRLRAGWWGVPAEELQAAADVRCDGEIALWFGPDPWEQLALVEVLAGAPAGAHAIVPLDRAVGTAAPADLPACFERRRPATGLAGLCGELWGELCADARDALARRVETLRAEPRLPHLPLALARILEDRRDERTARQVRQILADGVRDLPTVMARLHAMEHPAHGVWYGDAIVRRLIDSNLPNLPLPRQGERAG